MGVAGEEGLVQEGAPSCVKIHGRTYHRVLPADMRGTVRWYVHDPEERRQEATQVSLDLGTVSTIQQTLMAITPYARALRQLGRVPAARVKLHILWRNESSEIAAIIQHVEMGVNAAHGLRYFGSIQNISQHSSTHSTHYTNHCSIHCSILMERMAGTPICTNSLHPETR